MVRIAPFLSPGSARSLRRALLGWFARAKRDLPWRADRDPYRVWISEAMLQQTRVETVLPYYRRFLERFPTVAALAAAREEDVLAAWSGLGYYRRARSLQAAARAVVEEHGGRFPGDRESLLELPGIGPYTAGAIASIAFDRPEPLVDGNVSRVLCRLFGLDVEPAGAETWSIARRLVPRDGAGDWNQALMELGALVCTPRDPGCDRCPLAERCAALRDGRVAELPRKRPRRGPIDVETTVLAVSDGDRWLLERRPSSGRMAGMWQMPTVETSRAGLLFPVERPRCLEERTTVCELRHTITHHRIRATVKRAVLTSRRPPPPLAWIPLARLPGMALTGMTRKCLAAILPSPALASPRRTPSPPKHRRG